MKRVMMIVLDHLSGLSCGKLYGSCAERKQSFAKRLFNHGGYHDLNLISLGNKETTMLLFSPKKVFSLRGIAKKKIKLK